MKAITTEKADRLNNLVEMEQHRYEVTRRTLAERDEQLARAARAYEMALDEVEANAVRDLVNGATNAIEKASDWLEKSTRRPGLTAELHKELARLDAAVGHLKIIGEVRHIKEVEEGGGVETAPFEVIA